MFVHAHSDLLWVYFNSHLNMILVTHQIMLLERHTPLLLLLNDGIFSKSSETSKTLKPIGRGNSYQPSCISCRYICTKFFLFCPPCTTLVKKSAGFSSVLTCPVNRSPIGTASLAVITNTDGFLLKLRLRALSVVNG